MPYKIGVNWAQTWCGEGGTYVATIQASGTDESPHELIKAWVFQAKGSALITAEQGERIERYLEGGVKLTEAQAKLDYSTLPGLLSGSIQRVANWNDSGATVDIQVNIAPHLSDSGKIHSGETIVCAEEARAAEEQIRSDGAKAISNAAAKTASLVYGGVKKGAELAKQALNKVKDNLPSIPWYVKALPFVVVVGGLIILNNKIPSLK